LQQYSCTRTINNEPWAYVILGPGNVVIPSKPCEGGTSRLKYPHILFKGILKETDLRTEKYRRVLKPKVIDSQAYKNQ
jgi:hypothetical protein